MSVFCVRFVPFASMLVTAIIAIAPLANAFAQTTDEPSATVKVSPDRIEPGGTVTVSGLGYVQGGLKLIITVARPDGAKVTLGAVPDANGRYSTPYIGAPAPGDYTVSAQVGKNGAPATTHFKVESNAIDIDEDVADNKELLKDANDLINALQKQVEAVPDSPARSGMLAQYQKLEAVMVKVQQQPAQLQATLDPFKAMVAQRADSQPALQPMFDHLARLDQQQRLLDGAVEAQIRDSKKALAKCDTIDQATQGLKMLPEVLSVLLAPQAFVSGYAKDLVARNVKSALPSNAAKVSDAAIKAAKLADKLGNSKNDSKAAAGAIESGMEGAIDLAAESEIGEQLADGLPESVRDSEGFKFVAAETKKYLPKIAEAGGESKDLYKVAAAVVGDAIAFGNEQLFASYCVKFEGPFTATMIARFYAKNAIKTPPAPPDPARAPAPGAPLPTSAVTADNIDPKSLTEPWWTFGIAIKGKLTLRYPKDVAGKAVALSGQFEGGATRFDYKEDVWHNSDLIKLVPPKASLVGTKDVAPVATDDASGGVLRSIASPTSFYLPVSGQFADGKLTFKLQDARTDFNKTYTRGHTFYVVISPYTLMLPVLGHFTLPYMDAHFLMGHFKFDYPVVTVGKTMMIATKDKGHFPGPQNSADYTLDMKVCNPRCE